MAVLLLSNLPAGAGEEAAPDAPGLELLEYLGEWQPDTDGDWVDPVGLYASGLLDGPAGHPDRAAQASPTNPNRNPR